MLTKTVQMAVEAGYSSVAFPAIGVGTVFKYPPLEVVGAFRSVAEEFPETKVRVRPCMKFLVCSCHSL